MVTEAGEFAASPRDLYVDCTAAGVPPSAARPVFDGRHITIQFVAVGFLPWSAATIGFVESAGLPDAENNGLCPPVVFSGDVADLPELAYVAMQGQAARARHELVGPWNAASRLNPASALPEHAHDPDVVDSLSSMKEHARAALENLRRAAAASDACLTSDTRKAPFPEPFV
jgi:hypothetical protein